MLTGEIIQLDKKYYMDTFGDRTPIVFTEGKGSTLYDTNGKAYTDFLAGIAVNSLGYNHPKLTEAIINQAGKLLHCSNIFYIEAQAQLAKLLVENSCGNKVFFCNSGAEANEGAIKLVRKYFSKQGMNKYEILSADNSFHGRTLATIAATGQEKYQKPFKPMPVGFKHIPYNNLAAAKEAVTENTAAILIEVIQGEGGVIEGTIEYIQGLQKLCRLKGLLLIVDEVQTGIGRTGKLFGYEHYNIEPDIFTLSKGLGGGVPIGAIVAKGDAAEVFEPGDHGSTFGGNPLACSAGLAVLSTVLEKDFLKSCAEKGNLFKEGLSRLKEKFQFIKDVRGQGLILGMELDEKTSGKVIVKKVLNKGFIINCAGHNTLRFVPPLIIQENEIQRLLSTLHEIFLEESLVVK